MFSIQTSNRAILNFFLQAKIGLKKFLHKYSFKSFIEHSIILKFLFRRIYILMKDFYNTEKKITHLFIFNDDQTYDKVKNILLF